MEDKTKDHVETIVTEQFDASAAKCSQCGNDKITPNMLFCPLCGHKLEGESNQPPTDQSSPESGATPVRQPKSAPAAAIEVDDAPLANEPEEADAPDANPAPVVATQSGVVTPGDSLVPGVEFGADAESQDPTASEPASQPATPAAAPAVPKEPMSKKSKTIAAVVAVVAVLLVVVIGAGVASVNGFNEYRSDMFAARQLMLEGGAEAEDVCNDVSNIWYSAIFYDYSFEWDDEYYDYYSDDFNTAIALYYLDDPAIASVSTIESNQQDVKEAMAALSNPSEEFESAYESLEELYSAYLEMTNLALEPEGNYTSFNEAFSSADNEFMEHYDAFEIYVPDEK